MKNNHFALSCAIATVLFAGGCGGGGGGVKDTPPAPASPAPAPTPTPTPTPDPAPDRYSGTKDNLLVPINADLAHDAGATGRGAKIGLLDDGSLGPHEPLEGRITFYKDYTSSPGVPDDESNPRRGHATVIATSMVGATLGDFNGGVAPDADLYWGRICLNDSCSSAWAGKAADEMVDAGVRIFNLSLGTYYDNTQVDGAKFHSLAWRTAMQDAVDAGSLVVVATGNQDKPTSAFPAAAPIYEPSLVNNWLAVTAVDVNADGTVTTKSSYANACGAAADWCLAAPGLIYTPPVAGSAFQGSAAVGTSMATGVISGVAALVSGVYPWMDGTNLQQTLLTTATDLGAAGVDDVFGWGVVNAEKAIHGPAQFADDFMANVSDGSYVFSNDISGSDGIVKDGAGTLELAGNNTYSGATIINAGKLGFSGNTASDVVVNAGGSYVALGGVLGGDYTATATATTEVAIGAPLVVNGSANLDGTLRLLNPATGYTVAGREDVLKAGSVSGVFADTTYGNGFFWTAVLDYTATGVFADLTRVSGAASAASVNASQSTIDGARQIDVLAEALDGAIAAGTTEGLDGVMNDAGAVMGSNIELIDTSLTSLTGQIHGTARTLGVASALNTARVHADRLPHLAETTERTAWASATRVDGDLDRPGYAQASYRHDEATVGVDIPLGDIVVGASLTHVDTQADIAGMNDAMESSSTGATIYGVKQFGDAYVAGSVGYTDTKSDIRRNILVGTGVVGVSSANGQSVWSARIESGYHFDSGLTPFAAVGGIRHKRDAFTEIGDTSLGLSSGSDILGLAYADLAGC